jgi:RNA polymerase sigma-70 factor, ECF subfamily
MSDFNALYDDYAADVFRFALYLTGDRSKADDITAETFLRAWTTGSALRMATVKGYLITIARNIRLQQIREERRQSELTEDIEDASPDPARRSEDRSELDHTLRDLQQLPESDRAAILMRAVEGMSYEEIAVAAGLSLSAVKVKIHRARLRLNEMRNARRSFP